MIVQLISNNSRTNQALYSMLFRLFEEKKAFISLKKNDDLVHLKPSKTSKLFLLNFSK